MAKTKPQYLIQARSATSLTEAVPCGTFHDAAAAVVKAATVNDARARRARLIRPRPPVGEAAHEALWALLTKQGVLLRPPGTPSV
mmetsp:Transcript_4985/g.8751  ORF Transcript_4985/g.8751 Transcript_4985/m.8751 type:complete len:85 (+) Transcript_4985:673-927(+)